MNVLSLFDGMSCGRIALDRAGIKVDKYYASEIDKYAQIVSEKNYPEIIRLGDVNTWMAWSIEPIDLLIGGSPCQGFSFAGKQLNFDDPRSALFFQFVNCLHHFKPKYFLLENVVMKKEYQKVISDLLGVEPIMINSALVSAQNRKRLYWTNIPGVTPPEDKGIMLKDIIETGEVDRGITDKSFQYIVNKKGMPNLDMLRKSKCLTGGAHSGGTHSDMDFVVGGAIRGRYKIDGVRQDGKMKVAGLTEQQLEVRADHKTNTLTSVQKDNVIVSYDSVRKLTCIEYERLQTVPDNYTEGVSNSQRYKMLGNGWTIDIVSHIMKGLKNDN